MNFKFYKEISEKTGYFPVYHFQFSVDDLDIRKVAHKHGMDPSKIDHIYATSGSPHQIWTSLNILHDLMGDNNDDVDLGFNYKKKYIELANLLEPYRIDDMTPATTLKMILKYHK